MAQDLNRSIKIYIDNSDAMKHADALRQKIATLSTELAILSEEGKKGSNEYKEKDRELKSLIKTEDAYAKKVQETNRILKNLSGATLQELQTIKKKLRAELKEETRGTEVYNAKLEQYKRVTKEISLALKEQNSQLGAQGTLASRMANGFNKYFGMITTGLATLTGISFTFRKLSQDAAAFDDIYSDVMKTTGLTKDEVLELNEAFKKMDTRTTREDLNAIAEAGGRIGIVGEDIEEFSESMNIVNVALGDSFSGGVEEISTKLGKLKNLFRETKEMDVGETYKKIGSSINELGANGAASEPNIAEFALRVGSLPDALKPSVAETLALGAAFEESGIEAEVASRAYSILLQRASVHAEKFGRVMGVSADEVTRLINSNPLEFFLKFSESMKGMDATTTAQTLKELKINADGANKVLGAAANNTDRFRELLEMSNDAFREGTSVINEYNIKNNNAAAQLEKRKKAFKDAAEELGNRLNPALLKSTNYVTYLIKLLPGLLDFFAKYGKYIFYLVTAYAAYAASVKIATVWNTKLKVAFNLSNIALRAQVAWLDATKIATLAYNVVVGLLTGNFSKMRIAWKALTAAMATNPIGLLAVAVTAAVTGIVKLVQWLNRTSEATKTLKEATSQFSSELATEQREVNDLFDAYKRSNPEGETHLRIRNEIISRYGKYLQGLINEKGEITNIAEALATVNNELRNQIALKIKNQAADKIMTDSIDKQNEQMDEIMERVGKQGFSVDMQSIMRERINTNITDWLSKGWKIDNNLKNKIVSDLQENFEVDVYKGGFSWIEKEIGKLLTEVDNGEKSIQELDKKFAGMISTMVNTDFVVQAGEIDSPEGDTADDDPGNDKKNDKKKDRKYENALNSLEEASKNEMLLLKRQLEEKEITEKQFTGLSVANQEKYFDDKITLQEKFKKSTLDTEMEFADFRINLNKSADEQLLQQYANSQDALIASIEEYATIEKELLQEKVDSGLITEKGYRSMILAIDLDVARQRVEAAGQYLEEVENAEFKTVEAREKALKDARENLKKETDSEQRLIIKSNSEKLKATEDFKKKREAILDQLGLSSSAYIYQRELDALKKSFSEGLLSEEEYQQARMQIKAKYYAYYAQKAVDVAGSVADAVSSYHKLEADSLEAQKQRELSAAGSNAEEREKIEKKYAQKELDLRKKQAAANAAIQIAQATAAAALAIANIWGQHAPNPLLAGVLTALSATTTAFQIASIIKQKKAIMATTLDGTSGSPVTGTGSRVVTQRAKGKYDVIGADDKRQYDNVPYIGSAQTGFVSTPTLMGEQGRELVVSAPDLDRLQRHMNYPLIISAINDARSGVVPQRATGKYNSIPATETPQSTQPATNDLAIMSEVRELLLYLKNNPLKAYVVLSELQRQQELVSGSQKIGKK